MYSIKKTSLSKKYLFRLFTPIQHRSYRTFDFNITKRLQSFFINIPL